MHTILIADSGSTKTDWRLVSADGTAHAIQTNGFNPYYQTTEQIVDVLKTQLVPQLSTTHIAAVYYYGTGCTGPSVNPIVANALLNILPDVQTVLVDSDMLGAARGLAGHEQGIVCILGTGSNACCYDGREIIRRIQSLGFWLGDEGSGGYLGKTLVRDFFQDRLPDHLSRAFADKYGLDRPTLLENAYQKAFPNRYFAAFTPFLTENLSDIYIQKLVMDAFVLFLTTYVVRFPEATAWPVHFVGSIAHFFANPLRQAVRQTGLIMGEIVKAPIDGLVNFHRQA